MTYRYTLPLLAVLTLLVSLVTIDSRPLWTDELGTWALTVANSPFDWAHRFWHHHNSDGQIPLYHFALYLWTNVFGTSELALRWANAPWLFLAVWGLSRLKIDSTLRLLTITVFCLHPLVWYQLNEARPYILHLAGASWLLAGCINLHIAEQPGELDTSWRELLFGSFLFVGSSALGAFWIAGALLAFIAFDRSALHALIASIRRQMGYTALLLVACALLGIVAVHSHLSGARASAAADFSIAGLIYGGIEILGAAGLGPSRHELRTQLRLVDPMLLGVMAVAAGVLATCLALAWYNAKSQKARLMTALALFIPVVILVSVGQLLHWRVVGRHLSGGLPLLCLGLAFFLEMAWQKRQRLDRTLAVAAIIALVSSAIAIRVTDRHGKDDYRQAAEWASEALAQGKIVLWLADETAIGYYGLANWRRGGSMDLPAGLIPHSRFGDYTAAGNAAPDVIILSPREGVDPKNVARPILRTGQYRITATARVFELHSKQ